MHSQGCCQPQLVSLSLCPSQSMEKPSHRLFAVYLLHPSSSHLWQLITFLSRPAWTQEKCTVLQFKLHLSWRSNFFCPLFLFVQFSKIYLLQHDKALCRTAGHNFSWCISPPLGLYALFSNSLAIMADDSALSLGCDAETFHASLPEFECANSWQTFSKAAT